MVIRQTNYLGQMRVDLPLLRAAESSVAADFDLAEGTIFAGRQALVVKGFALTGISTGLPANQIQCIVAGSVLVNFNATESGSMFSVPLDRANETIVGGLNPKVSGAFTSSATNFIGIDLRRQADATTSDVLQFLNATTLIETSKTVPLARTLDYRFVISTSDFASQPNLTPLAKVVTDASNNIVSVQDARQLAFRLGSGGDFPNIGNFYPWSGGRAEVLVGDVFTGGDKVIQSQKDWQDAVMTRLWEIGGGEYWYAATADRNVNMVWILPTFTNGENFEWDGTHLHWQGIRFIFDNSTGYYNDVKDQTTNSVGLTNLADGECIYVDLDRSHNFTNPSGLQAAKAMLTTLGPGSRPGARTIMAWRVGTYVYTRGWRYPVGTIFIPATTTSLGVVELNKTPKDAFLPAVVSIGVNGQVLIDTIDSTSGVTGFDATTSVGGSSTNVAGTGGAGLKGTGGTGPNGSGTGGPGVWGAGGAGVGTQGVGVRGDGNDGSASGQAGGFGGVFTGGKGSTSTSGTGGAGLIAQGGNAQTGSSNGGDGAHLTGGAKTAGGTDGRGFLATGGGTHGWGGVGQGVGDGNGLVGLGPSAPSPGNASIGVYGGGGTGGIGVSGAGGNNGGGTGGIGGNFLGGTGSTIGGAGGNFTGGVGSTVGGAGIVGLGGGPTSITGGVGGNFIGGNAQVGGTGSVNTGGNSSTGNNIGGDGSRCTGGTGHGTGAGGDGVFGLGGNSGGGLNGGRGVVGLGLLASEGGNFTGGDNDGTGSIGNGGGNVGTGVIGNGAPEAGTGVIGNGGSPPDDADGGVGVIGNGGAGNVSGVGGIGVRGTGGEGPGGSGNGGTFTGGSGLALNSGGIGTQGTGGTGVGNGVTAVDGTGVRGKGGDSYTGNNNGGVGVWGTGGAKTGSGIVGLAGRFDNGDTSSDVVRADGTIDLSHAADPVVNFSPKNRVTRKNVAKAWFTATTDGAGAITLISGFNISTGIPIAIVGNSLTVTFQSAFTTSNYVAMVEISDITNQRAYSLCVNRSPGSCDVAQQGHIQNGVLAYSSTDFATLQLEITGVFYGTQ